MKNKTIQTPERKAYMKEYNKKYKEANKQKTLEYNREYHKNMSYYKQWSRSEGGGVYCFRDMQGEIVYIGETARIRARKIEHKNRTPGSFLNKLPYVSYDDLHFEVLHMVEDEAERKQIEIDMIGALKPKYNTDYV